ncbi:MAG: glycosyltransferase family 2 protein [Candidatus Rokuibacteriota bacterium]
MADGIFRCTVCGTRYLAPSRCCGEACVAGVLSPGAVADSPHPSAGEPSVSLVLLASARGDFEPEILTALSVAIATRNYGRWLPRCLDSVLGAPNPTAAPLQIVVTDDCSTDDTAAILEDYHRRHPRVLTPRFPTTTRGVPAPGCR